MRNTIMTEKIVKRGLRVASEYSADFLDQILVKDRASRDVVTLPGAITVEEARTTILAGGPGKAHQGFPVVGDDGRLLGVVTRRDLFGNFTDRALPLSRVLTRPPVVIYEDSSLREAADHMVRENVGRLVVVRRDDPARVAGILTRSDLLEAHRRRIDEADKSERGLALSSR
jgi:CBS domain-containing protein